MNAAARTVIVVAALASVLVCAVRGECSAHLPMIIAFASTVATLALAGARRPGGAGPGRALEKGKRK